MSHNFGALRLEGKFPERHKPLRRNFPRIALVLRNSFHDNPPLVSEDHHARIGNRTANPAEFVSRGTVNDDQRLTTDLSAAAFPAFSFPLGLLRGLCPKPSWYRTRTRDLANRPVRCYCSSSWCRCWWPGQWSFELFARQH